VKLSGLLIGKTAFEVIAYELNKLSLRYSYQFGECPLRKEGKSLIKKNMLQRKGSHVKMGPWNEYWPLCILLKDPNGMKNENRSIELFFLVYEREFLKFT
jgi:hypothetical protein